MLTTSILLNSDHEDSEEEDSAGSPADFMVSDDEEDEPRLPQPPDHQQLATLSSSPLKLLTTSFIFNYYLGIFDSSGKYPGTCQARQHSMFFQGYYVVGANFNIFVSLAVPKPRIEHQFPEIAQFRIMAFYPRNQGPISRLSRI